MEIKEILTVKNKLGIHARVASQIVNISNKFQEVEVEMFRDDLTVNAKSMMGVLMLGAAFNDKVGVKLIGPDDECGDLFGKLQQIFDGKSLE